MTKPIVKRLTVTLNPGQWRFLKRKSAHARSSLADVVRSLVSDEQHRSDVAEEAQKDDYDSGDSVEPLGRAVSEARRRGSLSDVSTVPDLSGAELDQFPGEAQAPGSIVPATPSGNAWGAMVSAGSRREQHRSDVQKEVEQPIHFSTSSGPACHARSRGITVLESTDPEQVTCDPCKQTDAFALRLAQWWRR